MDASPDASTLCYNSPVTRVTGEFASDRRLGRERPRPVGCKLASWLQVYILASNSQVSRVYVTMLHRHTYCWRLELVRNSDKFQSHCTRQKVSDEYGGKRDWSNRSVPFPIYRDSTVRSYSTVSIYIYMYHAMLFNIAWYIYCHSSVTDEWQ